jgi:hypothetical protein
MDARNQIRQRSAFYQPGGYLLLSPYGADIADASRVGALKGDVTDPVKVNAETVRDHLHESTASGRALVVHDEVRGLACGINGDAFAVLASNVDDGSSLGEKVHDTLGMATDLRKSEIRISKLETNSNEQNTNAQNGRIMARTWYLVCYKF